MAIDKRQFGRQLKASSLVHRRLPKRTIATGPSRNSHITATPWTSIRIPGLAKLDTRFLKVRAFQMGHSAGTRTMPSEIGTY
jgi:hypothetical protein